MENRAHAIAAGLFTLLLGLAVAAIAYWLGGRQVNATNEYVLVSKASVSGLNNDAQVRYRGIRAGKVKNIGLDPDDPHNILVRIALDQKMPVTRATTARLFAQGVTGLSYIMLDDDGSNSEPLQGRDGAPPRISLQPSSLDTLAQIVERVGTLLDEKTLGDLKRMTANLATASEGLREVPVVLTRLHDALSDENLGHLRQLLTHLERTAGEAAPLTRELRASLATFHALARRLDQLAGEAGGEMTQQTLPRMESLMRDMQQSSRQLNRVLQEIESSPQSLLFGRTPPPPGPGEPGFSP
ncbi:MAG: MCE family protein [Proteobacteria bacterium]|nr:MCE family protein [Pseudomonadota bacterium]HQR03027.1 MlaD family protein [Rhodocyclaceae bacterium]